MTIDRCIMMMHYDAMSTRPLKPFDGEATGTQRATVSFPIADYKRLEKLADERRVSVAWIVREAVNGYLASIEEAAK